MKKILFSIGLLSCIFANAQTTIVEEKFEKDNVPVGYNFLWNNKLLIQKGKNIEISANTMINSLYRYDSNGKKEALLENEEVMDCYFLTENSFKVTEYSKKGWLGKNCKYVINGVSFPSINNKEDFGQFYNDKNGFSISSLKDKKSVDFEKGEMYLSITDIVTRKNSQIKFEKPNLLRLKAENAVKYAKDLAFSSRFNRKENNFELITKFISKDHKSTTLYRTIYNFEGKKIDDLSYKINIQNGFLMYCNNGGGPVSIGTGYDNAFLNDLPINNFIVDEKTNEVYVYGLFGDHDRRSNNPANEPLGFYIFKFDRNGNKIWESIKHINDADFNDSQTTTKIEASLEIRNNELLFTTGPTDTKKNYLHYFLLDKTTGKTNNKRTKITYDADKIHLFATDTRVFLLSFYSNKGLPKKVFDNNGLIALETNKSFASYVKSIKNIEKLFFKTSFSNEGIWLIESDNKTYYKVTYFNS